MGCVLNTHTHKEKGYDGTFGGGRYFFNCSGDKSWMFAYIHTLHNIYIKYIHFCPLLILNKAVKILLVFFSPCPAINLNDLDDFDMAITI